MQILEKGGLESFIKCSVKYAQSYKKRLQHIYYQDLKNKVKYGVDAPIYGERIWINPLNVDMALLGLDRSCSGQVVDTWPPNYLQPIPVMSLEKIRCCIDHYVNGVAWEDTGIYGYMEILIAERGRVDGCSGRTDVIDRYKQIDAMFNQIKVERKLRKRKEINPKNFRETGGIYIHVGPSGELFFGGGGIHRFCITRILKLSLVPAQIGCVHQSAIPYLSTLRQGIVQNTEVSR